MRLKAHLGLSAALLAFVSTTAQAQETGANGGADATTAATDDIIVTAQRVSQSLQDVPISITVYDQSQLDNKNIVSASDLATYTPSLSVNQRFGPEKSGFAIRGFVQDAGTAPSVAVYLADVPAPRAQGQTPSGNSLGPGAFVDLANVQVLKGPQGTLFGRATTGGAVLVVPRKPTDNLEGYVEGSVGNYDLRRIQAVANLPLADTFKVRMMVDRYKRDGYMENHSGIGPKAYNDSDYIAARLGVLADLTPSLENYTLASYSYSHTNGYASRLVGCVTDPALRSTGQARWAPNGCNQIARQDARGDGLLDVEVSNPDPKQQLRQMQFINTTTWQATDTLVVKNIASYSDFRERSDFNLNGDNFVYTSPPLSVTSPLLGQQVSYTTVAAPKNGYNSNQWTFTEEFQLQGHAFDRKLDWQAGAYLEKSGPNGWNRTFSQVFLRCTDRDALRCVDPLGIGSLADNVTQFRFSTYAAYGQGTFNLTDTLSITGGLRYTIDKQKGIGEATRYRFSAAGLATRTCNDSLRFKGPTGAALVVTDRVQCHNEISQNSKRPTWLAGIDFKPSPDLLLYAKYSRGYRPGGINFSNLGLETWEPETVDAYELGAKATLRGAVRGYVSVAAFYNNFRDQQISATIIGKPNSGVSGAAGVINAGKSRIQGVEFDSSFRFFDSLKLDLGYTYLDTKVISVETPTLPADSPFASITPSSAPGDPLALSPKHRLSASLHYTVPLDESVGEIAFGGSYTYTSKQVASLATPTRFGVLGATNLVSADISWTNIMASNIDLSAFASNLTSEHYFVGVGNTWTSGGFENQLVGQPRMYGLRLRVNFGR
ncbi:TonB-dependent receptor [Novosphingobium sp. 9U]|uniref:TonB-dependent receptor n=1 Tax=Novosphingobium sp. 9U TaxID=2653158 RepID=UPI0012EF3B43|nr:TonB-dependent receptor [Novosphingobium sp. 9U]VWX48834.1 TonB-dependent receptor [Novosphingobium sp. 9U]